jgi:ribokinase
MDLVVRTQTMPAPGQTVLGEGFKTSPGGKGANQAVAVARLGGRCRMIGRVGDDEFGKTLLAGLEAEGIDCGDVLTTTGPSGVALIVVDSRGENSIVVASGANHLLTPDDIFAREEAFADVAVVVLQLELPLPTVRAALELAKRHGAKVVLDPAPAPKVLPPELYAVDVLTPNVSEAETLTGQKAGDERVDKMAASDLIERGAKAVVLKLGARGSLAVQADGHFYTVPAFKAPVVDTTAAGDAFTGALAVAIAQGIGLHAAARFANAAGALACSRMGAQAAMPTAFEVRALVEDQRDAKP